MSDFDIDIDALLNPEPTEKDPNQPVLEKLSALDQRLAEMEKSAKAPAPTPQNQPPQVQHQQPQQPYTNEQIAEWAKQDPIGYANAVTQLAVQQATQAAQNIAAGSNIDILTRQKKQENPHLKDFEQEIHMRASQQLQDARSRGDNRPVEVFIDEAIKHYDTIVRPLMGQSEVQRLNGMRLDVGANTHTSSESKAWYENPEIMARAAKDEKFAAQLRQQYLTSKGVSKYYNR